MRKTFARLLQALGLATLLAAVAFAGLLYTASRWLVVSDTLGPADAVVPLAGNLTRMVRAAELFRQGLAPRLYLSNARVKMEPTLRGLLTRLGHPEYGQIELFDRVMALEGVPREAYAIFGSGHVSTVEEAEALRAALGDANATLILVTAPFHTRRAKAAFEKILPRATILVTPSPYEEYAEKWWTDRDTAIQAVLEMVKTLHFLLGQAFRSTDGAAEPKAP
jgi:uncharacterized SAM-binding protein YcdF (DUF218 family)